MPRWRAYKNAMSLLFGKKACNLPLLFSFRHAMLDDVAPAGFRTLTLAGKPQITPGISTID